MIKTIQELKNLEGKRVLLRTDFDVSLDQKSGEVKDDFRIRAGLETIDFLLKKRVKLIIIAHLGRPGGKVVEELRLKPVYELLRTKYKLPINYYQESRGEEVKKRIKKIKEGEIVLLENLRFYPEEEKNDPDFAKELVNLADFFINDAFAVSHRSHTSTVEITKYLPSYAGFSLIREIETLSKLKETPQRPLIILLGGAKISDKIGVLRNFRKMADWILIGGALANNFLKAEGYEIGISLIEPGKIKETRELLENSNSDVKANYNYSFCVDNCKVIGGEKIILPCDLKVISGRKIKTKKINQIKKFDQILDIGPATIDLFSKVLREAKIIFWNGPMGFFEDRRFISGTKEIAKTILESKAQVVIGGGDTISAIKNYSSKMEKRGNIFISVGGGAMLDFLAGKSLPGIEVLEAQCS